MNKEISFTNDVFFKYALVQDDDLSKQLRYSIVVYLIPNTFFELKVLNPEIVPEVEFGKKVYLDVLLQDVKTNEIIAIEMQMTTYDQVQSKRFQFYATRLIEKQLEQSQSYRKLHKVYQIIFINGKCPTNNKLVNCYQSYNQDHEIEPDNLTVRIFVHLPVILDIVNNKGIENLNEFEILCYLFKTNQIHDILKIDKVEGMAKILMEKHTGFTKENALWSWAQAIEDGRITELSMMEQERAEGIEQGVKYGELSMLAKMIEQRYQEKCMAWLKTLNEKQIDAIGKLVFEIEDFKTFKSKIDATK